MMTGRKTLVLTVFALILSAAPSMAQSATVVEERASGELKEPTGVRITKDSYTGVEGR